MSPWVIVPYCLLVGDATETAIEDANASDGGVLPGVAEELADDATEVEAEADEKRQLSVSQAHDPKAHLVMAVFIFSASVA